MVLWVLLAALSAFPDDPTTRATLLDEDPGRTFESVFPTEPLTGTDPGDETFQIRGRAWFAHMSGHIEADATTQGTKLSIAGDTDLGGRVDIPEIEAHVNIPYVGRLYLGWWRYDNGGDNTLSRTITFVDHSFNVGTTVHTHLELNVAYLTYEYAFPKIAIGPTNLELGVELGLRFLSGDATVSDAGQEAESRGTMPALVLGARAIYQILPWLRTEAEVIGIQVSIDKEKVSYVETFFEAVAQPLPWLFGGVGYKYMDMTYRYRARLNFDLDLQLSGAYVTVGVRF
jgi:hypothetical protein